MTQMNLSTKQKQTHRHRERLWGGRSDGLGFGISRHKLLYTEWINNKALLRAQGTILNIL